MKSRSRGRLPIPFCFLLFLRVLCALCVKSCFPRAMRDSLKSFNAELAEDAEEKDGKKAMLVSLYRCIVVSLCLLPLPQ
jgi:hypothetical protein